jgi:hypothetical protein
VYRDCIARLQPAAIQFLNRIEGSSGSGGPTLPRGLSFAGNFAGEDGS